MRKIWRLQGISESYRIARRSDVTASERAEVNPQAASLHIDRWLGDPFARQTMLEMYESITGRAGSVATRMSVLDLQRYVKPELLEAFRRGDLVFNREPHLGIIPAAREKQKDPPVSDEPSAPPPAPIAKKTWIEIQVIDEQGVAVANVQYELEFSNGTARRGTLGSNGRVRVDGIEPGTCTITSVIKGARLNRTLTCIGRGDADSAANPGQTDKPPGMNEVMYIATIEEHKVRTGETIKSLAEANNMTWQELAEFNWETSVPSRINLHLRDEVGCTKKTKSGKNFMFDDSDDPGIVYIPSKWSVEGLSTGTTHVFRVRPAGRTPEQVELVIPVELDLEEDPNPDEEMRLVREDSGWTVMRSAGDTDNVTRDEERRLLLFNFGLQTPGMYRVDVRAKDEWYTAVRKLEIRKDGCRVQGKATPENVDDLNLGHPAENEEPKDAGGNGTEYIDHDMSLME